MAEEIVYMSGIVAVGFLANYLLRAFPFLLFGGRNREIPSWIRRGSAYVSPVIIGGLIVYAYSGSAWRTPWPYAAGVVTVLLHLWKRNSLLSIVAGTVVYMLLVNCCGCTTTVRRQDGSNPELLMRSDGVYRGGERLNLEDVVAALEDADIPKSQAIHIKIDRGIVDLRPSRALMATLAKGGYTRSLLITDEHGSSRNKSGDSYRVFGDEPRQEDAMFVVTRKGVRFGLLTRVEPNGVVACLRAHRVQPSQLIRLCGKEEDFDSREVRENMKLLEGILRENGYAKVKRFWVRGDKPLASSSPKSSRAPSRTIRYKSPGDD